jgi:DNA-binding transcriptional regulator YhcF (GntR family)
MPEARVRVDPADPTPPYEQVRRGVRDLISVGVLRPGDRLPPLRQLAGDLGLAVGTVARAYAELEAEGIVVSRRGAGTRVTEGASAPDEDVLKRLAGDYLDRAAALGVPPVEAVAAVQRAAADLTSRSRP